VEKLLRKKTGEEKSGVSKLLFKTIGQRKIGEQKNCLLKRLVWEDLIEGKNWCGKVDEEKIGREKRFVRKKIGGDKAKEWKNC
jgi:hypothetical protein